MRLNVGVVRPFWAGYSSLSPLRRRNGRRDNDGQGQGPTHGTSESFLQTNGSVATALPMMDGSNRDAAGDGNEGARPLTGGRYKLGQRLEARVSALEDKLGDLNNASVLGFLAYLLVMLLCFFLCVCGGATVCMHSLSAEVCPRSSTRLFDQPLP